MGARTTVSEPARSQEKTGRREKKRQEGKAEQDMSPVCLDVVEKMAKRGRRLIQVGGIITAVFAFTVLACLGDASYWLLHGDAIWFWDQLLNAIPCSASWAAVPACCGPACGKKQVRTYRNYLAMIGRRQTISISTLASATGASPAKVRDCLEDMLDDGLFPLGFLDYGGDRLVLPVRGLNDPAPGAGGKDGGEEGCPGGRGERGAGRDPGGERLHRRRGPSRRRSTASGSSPPRFSSIRRATRKGLPSSMPF